MKRLTAIGLLMAVLLLVPQLGCTSSVAGGAADDEHFVFYTAAPDPLNTILSLRIEELFRRLGKKGEVRKVESAERSLVAANGAGDDSGGCTDH